MVWVCVWMHVFFFFSSRRRHTRFDCDWSSDVCSSDLDVDVTYFERVGQRLLAADLAPELAQPLAIAAALLAEQQRAEATPPPAAPAPDGPSPWLLAARRESIGGRGGGAPTPATPPAAAGWGASPAAPAG